MRDSVKQFIEENIQFIDDSMFSQLYEFADIDLDSAALGELTEALYDSGINPLLKLNYIPQHFLACSNVGDLEFIPNHIVRIGRRAFDECANLLRIDLQNVTRLQYIDQGAFYDCNECEYLYLPDSLKIIGQNAFGNCTSLQYIKIGSNLEAIGFDAFRNCYSLLEIEIDMNSDDFFKNVTVAKNAFFQVNGECVIKFKDKQLDLGEFIFTLDGLK